MSSSLFVSPPFLPSRSRLSKVLWHRVPTCTLDPVPAAKRKPIRLVPPPSETAVLLRKPEAVVTVSAAGLFLLAASAFRSVRMAFTSVANRTALLSEARRRTLQLEKRQRERLFLESAVQATEATLENTKTFLAAQKGRAETTEIRLDQISASRQQLDNAASEIRQRRKDLAEKELELADERQKVGSNGQMLLKMEMELDRAKAGIEALEKVADKERKRLEEEEAEQKEMLKKAKAEAARLQTLLLEKEMQLEREREERDIYVEKHAQAERTLEVASESLERAVADLEARRRRIEDMEAEANRTRVEAQRKKEGIMAVVKGEVGVAEIEKSIATVQKRQGICEEAMKRRNDNYEAKKNQLNKTKSLIERRDAELAQLRVKLKAVATVETQPSVVDTDLKNGATSGARLGQGSSRAVIRDVSLSETNDSASDRGDRSTPGGKRTLQASMESARETKSVSALASATVHYNVDKTAELETKPKKRRGRPRKSEPSNISDADLNRPKRGRGRPRKVVNDVKNTALDAPKRKRGRPRKNPGPDVPQ